MERLKLDFTSVLRAHAERIQDEVVARLLAGESVEGGALAPSKGGKTAGVRSGAMLADVARRENVSVRPTSATIAPGAAQRLKWTVFNAGRGGRGMQPPRPVSGVSRERHEDAARAVAREARDQFVRAANRRGRS